MIERGLDRKIVAEADTPAATRAEPPGANQEVEPSDK